MLAAVDGQGIRYLLELNHDCGISVQRERSLVVRDLERRTVHRDGLHLVSLVGEQLDVVHGARRDVLYGGHLAERGLSVLAAADGNAVFSLLFGVPDRKRVAGGDIADGVLAVGQPDRSAVQGHGNYIVSEFLYREHSVLALLERGSPGGHNCVSAVVSALDSDGDRVGGNALENYLDILVFCDVGKFELSIGQRGFLAVDGDGRSAPALLRSYGDFRFPALSDLVGSGDVAALRVEVGPDLGLYLHVELVLNGDGDILRNVCYNIGIAFADVIVIRYPDSDRIVRICGGPDHYAASVRVESHIEAVPGEFSGNTTAHSCRSVAVSADEHVAEIDLDSFAA